MATTTAEATTLLLLLLLKSAVWLVDGLDVCELAEMRYSLRPKVSGNSGVDLGGIDQIMTGFKTTWRVVNLEYQNLCYMYFRSGSSLSSPSIVCSYLGYWSDLRYLGQARGSTYIVNTIPPLNISLASRGTAPDQKVKTPSFLNIFTTQSRLFL